MIKDTIEKLKDFVFVTSDITPEAKSRIFLYLSDIKSELHTNDYLNTQILARLDVYADICNKILDRLADRGDRY